MSQINLSKSLLVLSISATIANIDKVNANIDGQFKALRQDIIEVRAVAESTLTLAGKKQDDITDIRSELNNTKKLIAEIKANSVTICVK